MDQNYYLSKASSISVSSLLNYIFKSTVNSAAKSLYSVVSANNDNSTPGLLSSSSGAGEYQRWSLMDHFRYMKMMIIWFTIWVLRVFMDYFPTSLLLKNSSPVKYILDNHGFSSSSSSSSSVGPSSSSLDMILYEGSGHGNSCDDGSTPDKAITRALSSIFTLLNEIPATSRKYQFALTMAEKIVDENLRGGNDELHQINRTSLSSAFERTLTLLYQSLQSSNQPVEETSNWTSSVMNVFPLGSFIGKGLKFCLKRFLLPSFGNIGGFLLDTGANEAKKARRIVATNGGNGGFGDGDEWVVAEKLAQELLWITNKLLVCSAADEALVQWSFATGLAPMSLTLIPRVQGFIVKITAVLLGELARGKYQLEKTPREVRYRLLLLWLPLLIYANNGVSYPVLSGIEKIETERAIDEVILSLPASDQEVILTNWFQNFTVTNSDWPNLQRSYDQWCSSSRNLLLT